MELLATVPERHNQAGLDQQGQMFGDPLACHVEVATKLVERLAVILVKVIEEGAPTRIGQGFEDVIHSGAAKHATKWLHIVDATQRICHLAWVTTTRT